MLEVARKYIYIRLTTFDEIRRSFGMKHGLDDDDEKLLVNFQRMFEGTGKLFQAVFVSQNCKDLDYLLHWTASDIFQFHADYETMHN